MRSVLYLGELGRVEYNMIQYNAKQAGEQSFRGLTYKLDTCKLIEHMKMWVTHITRHTWIKLLFTLTERYYRFYNGISILDQYRTKIQIFKKK